MDKVKLSVAVSLYFNNEDILRTVASTLKPAPA